MQRVGNHCFNIATLAGRPLSQRCQRRCRHRHRDDDFDRGVTSLYVNFGTGQLLIEGGRLEVVRNGIAPLSLTLQRAFQYRRTCASVDSQAVITCHKP